LDETVTQVNYDDSTVTFPAGGKVARVLKPGDIIGENYRLKDLLGQGGMGVVYRCEHTVFGREYALKILSPDQVNDVSWKRFQIEGQAIARLEHVSIVKIYNMGVDGQDCPYYVMELLEGRSLEDHVNTDGPFEPAKALPIFYQLAEGMAYAHMKGIIHRDIKPSNIVLQPAKDGLHKIKIVDFGLAKVVKKSSQDKQSLTNVGDIFGSPVYMSPEQSSGQEVDARADIYSMGCTMFKTLTGRPPFRGSNSFETMLKHQSESAPFLSEIAVEKRFPHELEEMVHKMLEKNPDKRYQTMDQVCHDISRLMEGKSLEKSAVGDKFAPTPHKVHRSNSLMPLALGILLLSSAAAGYYYYTFVYAKQEKNPGDDGDKLATLAPVKTGSAHSPYLPVGSEMFGGGKPVYDKNMDAAIAAFREFQPRATKHFVVNGKPFRTIYFPAVDVAEIEIPRPLTKTLARGAQTLPDKCLLMFAIRSSSNRFTCLNPWILDKLDTTGITNVVFAEETFSALGSEGSGIENLGEKEIITLLNTLKKWPDLTGFCLRECIVTAGMLDVIETMPHLKYLSVENSETPGANFAGRKVLGRMKGLEFRGFTDIDAAIKNVPPNKFLEQLNLDRTVPSPQSLRLLAAFPNLRELSLEYTAISDEQLQALGKLTGIRRLHLEHSQMTAAQVEKLFHFKQLQFVIVSNPGWTAQICRQVKKLHPQMFIFDKAKKGPE